MIGSNDNVSFLLFTDMENGKNETFEICNVGMNYKNLK